MNIAFFGDSIMQGLYDGKGGWASRIKQDIYGEHLSDAEAWEDWNIVYMRANSGETSRGLKQRVRGELEAARDKEDHDWTVVFSVGMNDCTLFSDGEFKVSRAEYRRNVEEIIEEARKEADQVIAVGLVPVDESRVGPGAKDEYYLNEEVKAYENVFGEACREKGVKFIPLFNRLSGGEWSQKLFDGLHPNTEGHRAIYKAVKGPLMEEIELDI